MHTRKQRSVNKTDTILIAILRLIGLLSLYNDADHHKRGRPYAYPTTVMVRCFVVRIWLRIPSNNALHYYFSISTTHNKKIMVACGLHCIPDRRTFDRRFRILPIPDIISHVGTRFIAERMIHRITAMDSTILSCKKSWHKKDMEQGILPTSGIDTDAMWGFSKSKGWIFGYKLHMTCSTGSLAVPLTARVTTANVHDANMFGFLAEPLAGLVPYMAADSIYSSEELYESGKRDYRMILVCPIKRYKHTSGMRLIRHYFFKSDKGQQIIRRRDAIERLFDRVKDMFRMEPLPVRGEENVSSYLLACVLVYQVAVYYKYLIGSDKPQCVKHIIGM